ncbi:hypothetical protein D3C81_1572240 [compost metagenome]
MLDRELAHHAGEVEHGVVGHLELFLEMLAIDLANHAEVHERPCLGARAYFVIAIDVVGRQAETAHRMGHMHVTGLEHYYTPNIGNCRQS